MCSCLSFGFPLILAKVYALLETYLSPTALQKNKMKVSYSLFDKFQIVLYLTLISILMVSRFIYYITTSLTVNFSQAD
jgi:hypothetical protein